MLYLLGPSILWKRHLIYRHRFILSCFVFSGFPYFLYGLPLRLRDKISLTMSESGSIQFSSSDDAFNSFWFLLFFLFWGFSNTIFTWWHIVYIIGDQYHQPHVQHQRFQSNLCSTHIWHYLDYIVRNSWTTRPCSKQRPPQWCTGILPPSSSSVVGGVNLDWGIFVSKTWGPLKFATITIKFKDCTYMWRNIWCMPNRSLIKGSKRWTPWQQWRIYIACNGWLAMCDG